MPNIKDWGAILSFPRIDQVLVFIMSFEMPLGFDITSLGGQCKNHPGVFVFSLFRQLDIIVHAWVLIMHAWIPL